MFNPIQLNGAGMDPFYIAACNINRDVVIAMIEQFVPTYSTLLNNKPYHRSLRNIFPQCAKMGNAKAIRLLMLRGVGFNYTYVFSLLMNVSINHPI